MVRKFIILLKRRPGVTKEQFRKHYEEVHSVLGKKYIGHLMQDYRRSYPMSASGFYENEDGEPVAIDFEYDAITEWVVKEGVDLEELPRIIKDPKINPIFAEDEKNFLDPDSVVIIPCEEENTGTTV